jgi:ribosomal protein S27AE
MTPYLVNADSGDENDSERDDVCPSCGEYLPRLAWSHPDHRWACGDCFGGTSVDPQARSWEQAAWPFAENH